MLHCLRVFVAGLVRRSDGDDQRVANGAPPAVALALPIDVPFVYGQGGNLNVFCIRINYKDVAGNSQNALWCVVTHVGESIHKNQQERWNVRKNFCLTACTVGTHLSG